MAKLAEFLGALDSWKPTLSELGVELGTLTFTDPQSNEYQVLFDAETAYVVPA